MTGRDDPATLARAAKIIRTALAREKLGLRRFVLCDGRRCQPNEGEPA